MKKYFLIIVAMFVFTANANAASKIVFAEEYSLSSAQADYLVETNSWHDYIRTHELSNSELGRIGAAMVHSGHRKFWYSEATQQAITYLSWIVPIGEGVSFVSNIVRTGVKLIVKQGAKKVPLLILGSTGRTEAVNLAEQLAMKEAISNPVAGQIITKIKPLTDPRWLGWRKMQYIHYRQDGTKITIHYVGKWVKGVLKAVSDFKFK
jgi:hypothetical protein